MEKTKISKYLEDKIIIIERVFNASRNNVWDAFTTDDELEKWWAPKPWKAFTKTFDFSEGGKWHYYMLGPNGEKNWSYVKYLTIDAKNNFTTENNFCDENGKRIDDLPSMHWLNEFIEDDKQMKIRVTISFSTQEELNIIIDMGFEQGFSMGLNNLEDLLKNSSN